MSFYFTGRPSPFGGSKETFAIRKEGNSPIINVGTEAEAMALTWALNNPASLIALMETAAPHIWFDPAIMSTISDELADIIGTAYVVTCDNCQTEIVVGHAHWSSLVCTNEVCKCEIPNPKGEC